MKRISQWCLGAALMLLALCVPVPAIAVSTVAISPAGNGVFLVQGIGIEGSAALDITILYDTTTLTNPRVVQGPLVNGAMSAINSTVPGTVRMVMVRLTPVSGSGIIATVSFDRTGSSPGAILSLTAKLANAQGAPLAVVAQVQNPADVQTADASPSPEAQEFRGAVVATAQTGAPKIIIAGPSERAGDKTAPDTQAAPGGAEQSAAPEAGGAPRDEKTTTAQKPDGLSSNGSSTSGAPPEAAKVLYAQESIVDRFQEFKGKRTPEACISLFEQAGASGCKQDPPVAISDGKTAVRITFQSSSGKKTPSDVAVMGARLVSLKQSPAAGNSWVAEVVPEKGEYRATLAVSQGDVTMVCPLTVAPKTVPEHSRGMTITKADLDHYFIERNATAGKKEDVNRDGRRDYLDDYIITANYLASIPQKR